MKEISVTKHNLDLKEWVKRTALESDYDVLISEPCIIKDSHTGKVLIVYDELAINTDVVVQGLQRIKYQKGQRTQGLVSTSRIFGYRPRNEIRTPFCSSTSMTEEHPTENALLCRLAQQLEEVYKVYNPTGYSKHQSESKEKIKDEWRMENSIFTSGIVNKNNPLKYHFDTGNFNDAYSMMIVFKGGIEGGYLCCPEYRIAFELPNNSLFLFDGQSILHGVTPIKRHTPVSYRFSVVYYTLKRMWECLEITEELARLQSIRMSKERVRMENPLTEAERLKKLTNIKSLMSHRGKQ